MIHGFAEFFAQPFPLHARLAFAIAILVMLGMAPRWRFALTPAVMSWYRRLARGRVRAPLLVGGIAFLGAALIGLLHTHQPWVGDEFSNLLASDTFAHGRLVNPTHPLWRFFESYHILLHPAYMSKYPPAQGFLMALGQVLAGDPRVGIWLSSGLSCAALCWALRAWVGACWAFAGGLLMAAQLGIAGYWAQSFWGGMGAALGGALVIGAVPRLRRRWRPRDAAWLTVGAMILANSRPYEGFLVFLAAVGFLGVALLRRRPSAWRMALRLLPPVLAVAVPCIIGMGYYNWRVSGNAAVLPHYFYARTYCFVPDFFFLPLRPPPAYSSSLTAQYFLQIENVIGIQRYQNMQTLWGFIASSGEKFRQFWGYFYGPLLSLPFLLAAWKDERVWVKRLQSALAVFFLLMTVFHLHNMSIAKLPAAAFFAACILQIFLLFKVCRSAAARFALSGLCLIVAGILLEIWSALPHYLAPGAPLVFLLMIEALRGLDRPPRRDGSPGSRFLPVWTAAVVITLILQGASVVMKTPGPKATFDPDYIEFGPMSEKRAAIEQQLKMQPGNHLVIVHYTPAHLLQMEWVYNEADIDHARVVWAHDRGPDDNRALLDYFKDRKVWVVSPDLILQAEFAKIAPTPDPPSTPGPAR
jgi:hypothetical protein